MTEEKRRGRPKGSKDVVPRKKRTDMSWDGNNKLKPGDRGSFVKHALASWDLPKIDTSDPVQVEERIHWYFQHCVDDDLKPTVMGMCNALGISRDLFYHWGIGENRRETHQDAIKKARSILEEVWETYMVEGKINPIVGIFLGKNHFGYVDKKELAVEPKMSVTEPERMEDVLELYGGESD